MHAGSDTEALSAICWPITTDWVPETVFPLNLIVGEGALGRKMETPTALLCESLRCDVNFNLIRPRSNADYYHCVRISYGTT